MSSQEILNSLSFGEWVSGEEMATRLGISRAAVWKQIQSLRTKGYKIESSTRKGYRLAGMHDPLDADMICEGLTTKWLGGDLRCFNEVCSTNDVARSIARECQNGTVILAETQTLGRGRLSRHWASPPGGIWMSLVLKPKISLDMAYRINMAVSVAISRSLCALYGLDVGIKWPNDLLIEGRKVCGILMEISAELDRVDWAVVGLGVNANVDVSGFPVEWRATSLRQELGQEVSRIDLIQKLLFQIEETYQMMFSRDLFDEWRRRSATLGKQVRITSVSGDLSGEAYDLAEDGALLVRAEDKIKRVLAGDCIHLRAPEGT